MAKGCSGISPKAQAEHSISCGLRSLQGIFVAKEIRGNSQGYGNWSFEQKSMGFPLLFCLKDYRTDIFHTSGTQNHILYRLWQIRLYRIECQFIDSRRKTRQDRKSTRLNSSHVKISYAVF